MKASYLIWVLAALCMSLVGCVTARAAPAASASVIPSASIQASVAEPVSKTPVPPRPASSAFPTLDKPLFVHECYFITPNGHDPRFLAFTIDADGDPATMQGVVTQEDYQRLLKDLEQAFTAQGVEWNALQIICIPSRPGLKRPHSKPATPPANPPTPQPSKPGGVEIKNGGKG